MIPSHPAITAMLSVGKVTENSRNVGKLGTFFDATATEMENTNPTVDIIHNTKGCA